MSTEPDTITITLSRPITHEGKTVASLTFREATAGDACTAELIEHDFPTHVGIIGEYERNQLATRQEDSAP